ncbi:hypothetical protein [Asanoa iriomotensis]|uniref:Uncharacterized protein n=1 Tax=Asanoa iriomotensis TaxID=234613 RepID=A0ABQ4C3J5_9ACTN|nr:hypothetical protein [Asanoa iriomotensis]GIF57330.1 hypothetical protein Air01nite_34250 [Asanoa iriomotensis]
MTSTVDGPAERVPRPRPPDRPWNLIVVGDGSVLVGLCPLWPAVVAVPISPRVERTERS